ncbi:DUF1963 domain-containing protein [Streptomyces sp. NPDC005263]|uniref:DUF1963 domain-containing protein n=1 Tax=Streptomyces sp. NPDC005263 TaxID=3364711 RepID=UPI00369F3D2B
MRSISEQLVYDTAQKHGVPNTVAAELLAHSRPCVYLLSLDELSPAQRESARPAARTGGLPSLPDDVDWPDGREPLVLTVDCAALPHDVLDIELPTDGHLLFFSEIEYEPESSAVLHVPAGAQTTERPSAYDLGGETAHVKVYEPQTLYPVAGLTLHHDWSYAPARRAFLNDGNGNGNEEILDEFEGAVLELAAGGAKFGVCAQLGGFSDPYDMPPDEGDLVLFAQIAGQAIDYNVYTLNLITGTRQDITARRYTALEHTQQC